MPVLRKDGPYIWTTWLTKLLVGDNSCEWASWFKAQFDGKSWTKAERVGNLARWQIGHNDMLKRKAQELREQGYEVTLRGPEPLHRQLRGASGSPWPASAT